jgi:hypothetical protein
MKYLQPNYDKAFILDKLPFNVYEHLYIQAMDQLYITKNSEFYWDLRKQLYRPLNTIMQWNIHKIVESL